MAKSPKVLVVEDEAILRFAIIEHLSANGFEVLEARHSAEAFDILEKQPGIDFLLTDIDMPGTIDGLMLAKFSAERWPQIRVAVVSGKRKAEITDLPDGSIFFPKPYNSAAICRELKSWTKRSPAR